MKLFCHLICILLSLFVASSGEQVNNSIKFFTTIHKLISVSDECDPYKFYYVQDVFDSAYILVVKHIVNCQSRSQKFFAQDVDDEVVGGIHGCDDNCVYQK